MVLAWAVPGMLDSSKTGWSAINTKASRANGTYVSHIPTPASPLARAFLRCVRAFMAEAGTGASEQEVGAGRCEAGQSKDHDWTLLLLRSAISSRSARAVNSVGLRLKVGVSTSGGVNVAGRRGLRTRRVLLLSTSERPTRPLSISSPGPVARH